MTVPIRPQRRCLNLRAAKKADDNIRPRFVIRVQVRTARLCGGGCGAVDGAHAYLSIPTLIAGLPAGTGTAQARGSRHPARAGGVAVDLGTRTAGRFYERLGCRVTHRLVRGSRTRVTADGRQIDDDLVMLRTTL